MRENQNIEWKEAWRDEYLKWICGFANAQGGRIYIGCDDTGNVIGVKDIKKLLEEIPNKIVQHLGIVVDVNHLTEDGKDYVEIVVPACSVGISYKGIYHYRSGSTKQQLSGPALEAFLLKKRGITWDNLALTTFKMEDVDDELIDLFKELARKKGRIDKALLTESKEVLLDKLHLKHGDCLTNAAMLLFSKDPEKYQVGAYVKIGYFESDSDLRYQDEIHGSLLQIVDRIIETMHLKYMRAKITYEGIQRKERYIVPDAALREALLNALCHSQYSYGIPIQISVYADRIYIANSGGLPENWTKENLMRKHASRPTNPTIAQVFYLAGFIESWGRGIEKICEACVADGLPMPEYTIHSEDVMLKFCAPLERVELGPNAMWYRSEQNLSLTERYLLKYIHYYPECTYADASRIINRSKKTVYTLFNNLKEKGLVERIGTSRNGYWRAL